MNLDFIQTKTLLKIIQGGIFFIFFLPLVIIPGFWFPFMFPKVILFQVVIEVLFIFYLLLCLKEQTYWPKLNLLTFSILVFFIITMISTIFSVDQFQSFWGSVQWHNSLFLFIHLMMFYFILQVFRDKKTWFKFLKVICGVGVVIILASLLQRIGVGFTKSDRVDSFLGNPAFLASYLIFVIFLIAILLIKEKNKNWKIFYGVILGLGLLTIFLTQTRGAWFGLLTGIAVSTFLYFIFYAKSKNRKIFIIIFLLLFLASILIFSVGRQGVIENLGRQSTIQTRIIGWQITWQAWQEHFWLGWGLENFYIGFNQFINPEFLTWATGSGFNYETVFNFPHNKLLEVGFSQGLLGIIAYLGIFVSAGYLIWRKKDQSDYIKIILFSLLIAYLIQNLFLFDFIISFIFFYFVLALINVFYQKQKSQSQLFEKSAQWTWPVAAVILISILIMFYQGNWQPVKASYISFKAWRLPENQFVEKYRLYEKAFNYNTYVSKDFSGEMEKFLVKQLRSSEDNRQYTKCYAFTINVLQENLNKQPLILAHYLRLAELYNAGRFYDEENLNKAEEILISSLDLAPNRPEPYLHLGQTKFYQEDYEAAFNYFDQAIEINNNWSLSHLIKGRAHMFLEQKEDGVAEIKKALDLGYQGANEIKFLINYYLEQEEFEQAWQYYERLLELNPNDKKVKQDMAILKQKINAAGKN